MANESSTYLDTLKAQKDGGNYPENFEQKDYASLTVFVTWPLWS